MKLKVCGLTNADDVRECAKYADALGFIVDFPSSPRSISLEQAEELIGSVPPFVSSVVVIPDFDKAFEILGSLNPTMFQLHGDESPRDVKDFRLRTEKRVVKACGWGSATEFAQHVDVILIDDKYSPLDFDVIADLLKDINTPVMIAGHLDPDNILELLSRVSPYGVDVASGVEASPGKKDLALVKRMRKMIDLGATVGGIVNKEREPIYFKFFDSLADEGTKIITEIKPSSPSQGDLKNVRDDLENLVRQMEEGGASAISVLVEEKKFGGSPELLACVRKLTKLPILAKGFIDGYRQMAELALCGADAVLLMPRVLEAKGLELKQFLDFAYKLGLDSVVEVADRNEMNAAVGSGAAIIQINNRDIYGDLAIDLRRSGLGRDLPPGLIFISASGVSSAGDMVRIREITGGRADAVLVGTGIMLAEDIRSKVSELVNYEREVQDD